MKIKLSKLRKIINEELSRQLNEADGDAADKAEELRMKSLRDKVKKLDSERHATTVQMAQIQSDSAAKELSRVTQAAKKSAATSAVTESDSDDDDIIDDDDIQEDIIKTKGKPEWCLYSKKGDKNLGCYDSRKGAKERDKQVAYFKNVKKKHA